jgi:uncharacterized Zn finger protein
MKRFIACLAAGIAASATAQTPPAPAGTPVQSEILRNQTCSECGEVRSVRRVERQPRPSTAVQERERHEPSGLVATIPLDGSKPRVGSSAREEKRREPPLVTYEIIVRMDDGRVRIVSQDEGEDLHLGDKVRVEENKVKLR